MSAADPGAAAAHGSTWPLDCAQQIEALRQAGAHLLDPVGFHYLDVLRTRALAQPGRVRGILEHKLVQALADFRARLAQAQSRVQSQLQVPLEPQHKALQRSESLADLVRSMAQAAPAKGQAGVHHTSPNGPELKSVRMFRNTWSKLSADKQLKAALDQAPKNAGPINSHMLVLRSLALMRALSPDYFNRFISYADTLVHLEQSEKPKAAPPKPEVQDAVGKKPKPRRTRTRQSG